MRFIFKDNRISSFRRLFYSAAVIVVFITVYSLILPAITMEKKTYCGIAEHEHTDSCYTVKRTCICGQDEIEGHTHTDDCYTVHEILACGLEENEEHTHSEECYETEQILTCGRQEAEGHTHDDSCFTEEKELTCGQEEHIHSAECFVDPEAETEAPAEMDAASEKEEKEEKTAGSSASDEDSLISDENTTDDGEERPEETSGTDRSTEEADEEEIPAASEITLEAEGDGYHISVICGPDANVPQDAGLAVSEILQDEPDYDEYVSDAKKQLEAEEGMVSYARFFDITIIDASGREICPEAAVDVKITLDDLQDSIGEDTETEPQVVHFGEEPEMIEAEQTGDEISFAAEGFSVYGVIGTTIEKIILAEDGHNYKVTVEYGEDTGIPANAELSVEEITEGFSANGKSYEEYVTYTENALGMEEGSSQYIRLFDISIMKDGEKIQPAEGSNVDVRIELADSSSDSLNVVHFADGTEEGEEVQSSIENGENGAVVAFQAEGFSVYSIVELDEFDLELEKANGFYLSYGTNPIYVTNGLDDRNGVFIENANIDQAAVWFFEKVEGESGKYYIYTMINDVKKYVHQKYPNSTGNQLNQVDLADQGTAFVVSGGTNPNTFFIKHAEQDRWLQHSGGGKGIRFYTDTNNAANSCFTLTYADSSGIYIVDDDYYGLDGKTCGIVYNRQSTTGAALMATDSGVDSETLIVKHDVLYHNDTLLVAKDSNISQWTFESVSEDRYYLYTVVDGVKQYLTINGSSVTLTPNSPDPVNSLITVTPGTGENSGKFCLTVRGYDLNVIAKTTNMPTGNGKVFSSFDGFQGVQSSKSQYNWMNLAVTADNISDEDFTVYTAQKVSVSHMHTVVEQDEEGNQVTRREYDMPDGAQVVMYTRIWNEALTRYDFFVVDYDGTLLPAFDEGDMIEWTGTQYNTASLQFTEYHNADGTPNYYYELENYYGKYFSPSENGILSDSTVGINMNGRRFGYDYTPIIAWDEASFRDWGFEIEDGKLVARETNDPEQDFYFAIVKLPESTDEKLSTVDTIDNGAFGITMKMINFNNGGSNRDPVQNPFFTAGGKTENQAGILSTQLTGGYPANGAGESLSALFNNMTTVNHLFIESIHNESGYFEYDSTQNFAHLEDNGDFTVYNQLGAIDNSNSGPTRTHGQFMPYNTLNITAEKTLTNQTDITGNLLSDLDPRKGETLYPLQGKPDYFYGMEMSASFTQTPSGLDDWGNDIIFEFSGDDDFWLYVNDELVLDLGGIHSAMSGKVNFRTGIVTSDRAVDIWEENRYVKKNSYTLREIFETNYRQRNPNASVADVAAFLGEYFDDGENIFREYTNHTMKIFYMERGAGASNLHMRLNLASVKPGRVILKKTLSGISSKNFAQVKFPFQILYQLEEGGNEILLEQNKPGQGSFDDYTGGNIGDYINVFYENTSRRVEYADSLVIKEKTYNNVFLLKPGESAEIDVPDNAIKYRIVECGVDADVYDKVKESNIELEGTDDNEDGYYDFGIGLDTTINRPRVHYDNHVNPEAVHNLTITKKLYREDGVTELTDDDTQFKFRLYIGSSSDADADLVLADRYQYRVKNRAGAYCYWDRSAQRFVPFEPAVTDFNALSAAQQKEVVFNTSMYGTIDRIASGFTVEVPDLLTGTRFRVEERDDEIPDGYSLQQYRLSGGTPTLNPVNGMIEEEDPNVEVDNLKGWGLRINKTWSDADFMASHDPIYFAIYIGGVLNSATVRRMDTDSNTLYWYFERLEAGKTIQDYVIKEVKIEPASSAEQVDANGHVTLDAGMTVTPYEEGNKLILPATRMGETDPETFDYTVHYRPGTVPEGKNIRIDEVTNSRPGIRLYKTDWSGTALAGAKFCLTTECGTSVGTPTMQSDESGLVTTICLDQDGVYYLAETGAPAGCQGMPGRLILTRSGGDISVSGEENAAYYSYDAAPDDEGMTRITIRNKRAALKAVKVGSDSEPLEGVSFELHMQGINDQTHEPGMVNRPMDGYENLITDEQGIIPDIDLTIRPGTYYLKEKAALPGYSLLDEPLCFSISALGEVSLDAAEKADWLTADTSVEGEISYTIMIPNEKVKKVSFRKVDISDPDHVLENAKFALYRTVNGVRENTPLIDVLTSDSQGMLTYAGNKVFTLENGVYHLVETAAPENYQCRPTPVIVTVADAGVAYDEGTVLSQSGRGVVYDSEKDLYTLKVSNSTGYALPSTGGPGTKRICISGILMMAAAAAGLLMKRTLQKRKESNR